MPKKNEKTLYWTLPAPVGEPVTEWIEAEARKRHIPPGRFALLKLIELCEGTATGPVSQQSAPPVGSDPKKDDPPPPESGMTERIKNRAARFAEVGGES